VSSAAELMERDAGAMVRRLFAKDAGLWGLDAATPELTNRMGWLGAPQRYAAAVPDLLALRQAVSSEGVERVVLLGMGGSSLAPEVFGRMFAAPAGTPPLTVVDTTHPDAVLAVLDDLNPARTLFVVSSKSGGTIETSVLNDLCWARAGGQGARFIAITDPGSGLATLAAARGFRRCFENDPEIGGRYSALSFFGLVPAALAGVPVEAIVSGAERAATASAGAARAGDAAGVVGADLGAHLGAAWLNGRDKLTLRTSPAYGPFGVWMEQLVAESTGKHGKGIVPVVDEPVVARAMGSDRVVVAMLEAGRGMDEVPGSVAHAITGLGPLDLGREFYRWEVATALAGAWLQINPFDQPNVAESKKNSEQALAELGAGTAAEPAQGLSGLSAALRGWLGAIKPGDYAAILAYVPATRAHDGLLEAMRRRVLEKTGVATTAGYGPRFLHSTGQLHKGGPATGAFLQIETEPARDVDVPGRGFTLGRLIQAQALGDWRALVSRGRRVLRVRVKADELPGVAAALNAA